MTDQVKPPTVAEVEANRIAELINFGPFKYTVRLWLEEAVEEATQEMASRPHGQETECARGKYLACKSILDRIDYVQAKRLAQLNKTMKEKAK